MKKIWKKLIAGGLAVVCSITAMATNGFGLFSHSEQEEMGDDNQLHFSNFIGNGMMLKASAQENFPKVQIGSKDFDVLGEDYYFLDYDHYTCGYYNEDFERVNDYDYVTMYNCVMSVYGNESITYEASASIDDFTVAYQVIEIASISSSGEVTFSEGSLNWSVWHTGTYQLQKDTRYILLNAKLLSGDRDAFKYHEVFVNSFWIGGGKTPEVSVSPIYLSAIILPVGANTRGVVWTIAFANPYSSWASSRTVSDYIKLTQDPNDDTKVKVSCLKAFGERIIITASLKDFTEISAQCTLDYSKKFATTGFRLVSQSADVGGSSLDLSCNSAENSIITVDVTSVEKGLTYATTLSPQNSFSAGTLMPESITTSFTLEMSDGLRDAMRAKGLTNNFEPLQLTSTTNVTFDTEFFETNFGFLLKSPEFALLKEAINDNSSEYDFTITCRFASEYDKTTLVQKVRINADSMILPEGLALNYNSIIF